MKCYAPLARVWPPVVSLTYSVMPGSVEGHVQGGCHAPGDPSAPAKPGLLVGHLTPQDQAARGLGVEARGDREPR